VAYLIPENLRSRRDVPPGIARFATALRDGLVDDVIVWYEPLFDVEGERPDLVLLSPNLGILVMEVLESRAGAIGGVRDGALVVSDGDRERLLPNPLIRAETFAEHLASRIQTEPRLAVQERLPVLAAAVLPYLSHEASVERGLGAVLPLDQCIYRGDIENGMAAEAAFRRRISRLLGSDVRDPLSEDAERIHRAIIHPDTVIGSRQLPFPTVTGGQREDEMLVLDRKQEGLAKSLGVGHRVIRGAAGSGKTLVLTYRARLLADTFPRQRILVTCFTRSLAGRLRRQLQPWSNITVKNLDTFMDQARRAAGGGAANFKDQSREDLAEQALQALDTHPNSVSHFHHVLIDEAQDFPTPALTFAVRLLIDGSESLLAVADPVQNIFRTKFTWKAAGINAVGRTRWLDQSYRNTREILEYAHSFVMAGGGYEISTDPDPDNETTITAPHFSTRSGPLPLVISAPSRQGEILNLAIQCRSLLDRGVEPGDIAILYGVASTGGFNWPQNIQQVFARENIPILWANDPAYPDRRDHIGEDTTKILLCTIFSAKGLEYRHVILCGFLDDQPPEQSLVSRSLIYVGMTRATHELTLSASGKHPYLADLERS
jgi:hypothetical protein